MMDSESQPWAVPPILERQERAALIEVARDSIGYGLRMGAPLPVEPNAYAAALRPLGVTFVTLRIEASLRGCVGSLAAVRPIVTDVAHHAYQAAFHDPRFPNLAADERDALQIHISLLSPPQPMSCDGEDDLIAQLRPGIDGLVLEQGPNRGTFLPSVWAQIPQADRFLAQLKVKAGVGASDWPRDVKVSRYTVQEIE
jgi:hypothetical protein